MFNFDSLCWLCRQPLFLSHHGICSLCLSLLPKPPTCCPRCGLPAGSQYQQCGRCQAEPPIWHQLVFVTDYRPPLSKLLLKLKFQGNDNLAPMLARIFLTRWLNARRDRKIIRPDLLISVPLHKKRQWRRGFNQTALLAKPLAYWIGCNWFPETVVRSVHRPAQTTLGRRARQHNLNNIFDCQQRFDGLNVAIFDDVITSGSTMKEMSRVLLDRGARSIQAWCICRTL